MYKVKLRGSVRTVLAGILPLCATPRINRCNPPRHLCRCAAIHARCACLKRDRHWLRCPIHRPEGPLSPDAFAAQTTMDDGAVDHGRTTSIRHKTGIRTALGHEAEGRISHCTWP